MRKIILVLEVGLVIVVVIFAFFLGVQFSDSIKASYPSLFGVEKDTMIMEETEMDQEEDKSLAEIKEILEEEKDELQEQPIVEINEIEDDELFRKQSLEIEDLEKEIPNLEGGPQAGDLESPQESTEPDLTPGEMMPIKENDVVIPEGVATEVQIEIGEEPVKIEGVKGIEAEEIVIE
ncbi:hypothetical protein ACFL0U_01120 [Pseudomonadota bacterium]